MCGLYSFRSSPEEVRTVFAFGEDAQFPPRDYVAPGQPIAIVRMENHMRRFALVRWGFIPGWVKEPRPGKPLINARSETIFEKPSFKAAIRRRRCLIPTDGFYEWKGNVPGHKQPYFVTRPDCSVFAFAGVWEHWMSRDGSELETAAIITTRANHTLSAIHPRMPVVIRPEDHATWLTADESELGRIAPLLASAPDSFFIAEPTRMQRRAKAAPSPAPDVSSAPDQLKLF